MLKGKCLRSITRAFFPASFRGHLLRSYLFGILISHISNQMGVYPCHCGAEIGHIIEWLAGISGLGSRSGSRRLSRMIVYNPDARNFGCRYVGWSNTPHTSPSIRITSTLAHNRTRFYLLGIDILIEIRSANSGPFLLGGVPPDCGPVLNQVID